MVTTTSLALVADTGDNNGLVDLPFGTSAVSRFRLYVISAGYSLYHHMLNQRKRKKRGKETFKTHRHTPRTLRMDITLTLTPTTTVRMILRVHSQTSNRRPDAQPPTPTGLTELSVLEVGIAYFADGGAAVAVDVAYFA